jgi:two-component system, OmpR family, sensor histidine kinase KdpD
MRDRTATRAAGGISGGRWWSSQPAIRRVTGWSAAVVGMPALAIAMTPLRGSSSGRAGALLVLLLGTVVVAATGGLLPGIVSAVVGFGVADWFYVTPLHSLRIDDTGDIVMFAGFLTASIVVSVLADRLTWRDREAERTRLHLEALTRPPEEPGAGHQEGLLGVVEALRIAFGLESVSLLSPLAGAWLIEAASGTSPLASPDAATVLASATDGSMLVATCGDLNPSDRLLLRAFASQVLVTIERLHQQAAVTGTGPGDIEDLREAILRAVTHDLRTPLASIKAAATSMLTPDVHWSDDAARALCEIVDEEADRLDRLIGNLLAMSRLQGGALDIRLGPVSLSDVVGTAILAIRPPADRVFVDFADTLPLVAADGAMLQRAVANVVENALRWSPDDRRVRVGADVEDGEVWMRVVDHGSGITDERRAAVFEPFQRLDDGPTVHERGLGLGLAVARAAVEASGGSLVLEETPGGGTTAAFRLPVYWLRGTAERETLEPAG